MGDLSRSLTEGDILREFEKRAIQIVKDNLEHFLQYKSLEEDEEFLSDRETVISIANKYVEKNLDFPRLIGLEDVGEFFGIIKIEGTEYEVWEDLFDTDDGINVIKTILDLIKIEYECKICLKRPICIVTEHIEKCEGADELWSNYHIYGMLKNILDCMQ